MCCLGKPDMCCLANQTRLCRSRRGFFPSKSQPTFLPLPQGFFPQNSQLTSLPLPQGLFFLKKGVFTICVLWARAQIGTRAQLGLGPTAFQRFFFYFPPSMKYYLPWCYPFCVTPFAAR